MTPETVIDVGREALEVTIFLMLILLIPALIVGVLVSLFQAVTQINEVTLSFIPKLLITVLAMIIGGPLLLRLITDFTLRLFDSIPAIIG